MFLYGLFATVMYKLILVPAKVSTENVCKNIFYVAPCFSVFLCLILLIIRVLQVFLFIWYSICFSNCYILLSRSSTFMLKLSLSCTKYSLSVSYCLQLALWFHWDFIYLQSISCSFCIISSSFLFMFSLMMAISLATNCLR